MRGLTGGGVYGTREASGGVGGASDQFREVAKERGWHWQAPGANPEGLPTNASLYMGGSQPERARTTVFSMRL